MVETIIVRKGNIELNVPGDQKQKYLDLGYCVYDSTGNIVEEAPLTDTVALQTKIKELLDENAKLKADIAKLSKKTTTKKEA